MEDLRDIKNWPSRHYSTDHLVSYKTNVVPTPLICTLPLHVRAAAIAGSWEVYRLQSQLPWHAPVLPTGSLFPIEDFDSQSPGPVQQ